MSGLRRARNNLNFWPGYVDGLAGLLMMMMFLLLFYVLGELALSSALDESEKKSIERSNIIQSLMSQLNISENDNEVLNQQVTSLRQDIQSLLTQQQENRSMIAILESSLASARQTQLSLESNLFAEQTVSGQLRNDVSALERRQEQLNEAITQGAFALSQSQDQLKARDAAILILQEDQQTLSKDVADLARQKQLLDEQIVQAKLALEKSQESLEGRDIIIEEQNFSVKELKERAQGMLSELAQLNADILALRTLQRQLQEEIVARDQSLTEQDRELIQAQADVRQLSGQIKLLNKRLSDLHLLLNAQEAELSEKDLEITDLGSRLNTALASELSRLQRYRSEFLEKMRDLLSDQSSIKIVGDRFVFQSEVLFPSSSDQLTDKGRTQLREIASVLKRLIVDAPSELPWVLRIDGHTDSRPINTMRFPSNWELSSARAIAVVRFLNDLGIPANRLAATGFGDTQLLETRDDEIAHRRNRRIEMLLTQR